MRHFFTWGGGGAMRPGDMLREMVLDLLWLPVAILLLVVGVCGRLLRPWRYARGRHDRDHRREV